MQVSKAQAPLGPAGLYLRVKPWQATVSRADVTLRSGNSCRGGYSGGATLLKHLHKHDACVSCMATSMLALARTTPVSPPSVKRPTNPSANSMGAVSRTEPPYEVASQEKTLIPVGRMVRPINVCRHHHPLTLVLWACLEGMGHA
jgi:hypothetical protein